MRSLRTRDRGDCGGPAVLACALLILFAAGATCVAVEPPLVTDAEVTSAVDNLATDPNMGVKHKIHTLHFDRRPGESKPVSTLGWLRSALDWLAATGRLLLWTLVAVLAAVLLVMLLRTLRQRRPRVTWRAQERPATHVGTLDIRPESLPADIGAAAMSLWNQGQQRAALSLLYRGALSRLVHQHAVPIQDSNTESECASLAAARVSPERARYVKVLIDCWISAVYAGHMPASGAIHTLCEGFGAALDTTGSVQAMAVSA